MTWIDATTQLPEHDPNPRYEDRSIDVLVYCAPAGQVPHMHVGYYDHHNEQWTDGEFDNLQVTHWMRLPDPPVQAGKTLFGLPVREVDDLPTPEGVRFGPSPLSEAYPFWVVHQALKSVLG